MKAENLRISKLFSSGGDIHYILPHFQREYTWGKEEWATLYKDAMDVYDEAKATPGSQISEFEHFLGSIVVIPDGTRSGTMVAFKLVDGQQRLTTLTLVLQALAQAITSTHPATARKIERLLVNTEEAGDLYFKILPTTKYGDRAAYSSIMRGETPEGTVSRIPAAYQFFVTEIRSSLAAGLDADCLFLILTNAFQIVFIELQQNESPYKIFESLNAKGKPLSQADLVRNYIAMKLPALLQEKVFAKSWGKIEGLLQENRLVGRLGELTAFIRHYLALRTEILVDERHIYARFRDRMEKLFPGAPEFAAELEEMTLLAVHYNGVIRPLHSGRTEVSAALERLNRMDSIAAYPFLLALFEAHSKKQITDAQLLDVLTSVENYLVRRYLANEPVSYLNKLFPTIWSQLDKTRIEQSVKEVLAVKNYPSNERLMKALEYRKLYDKNASVRWRTGLILETINRKLSIGTGGYTVLDNASTIEHIMPQTLSGDWKTSLGLMWETIHKDYLHVLGNLTLITGDWNLQLSNNVFDVKKRKLAAHALRINSQYFSQPILRWGRDEIRERTEILGESILEIWPPLGITEVSSEAPAKRVEAMEFHFEAIEKVTVRLGFPLVRLSQSRFESQGQAARLVALCSKHYAGSGEYEWTFWYGFKPSQRDYLSWSGQSWVALECQSPDQILLFPFSDFEPLLRKMNATEGKHWHVSLASKGGSLFMHLPSDKEWRDISTFLLKEPASSS